MYNDYIRLALPAYNIKTWTGLPEEESVRMAEDRDNIGESTGVWPTVAHVLMLSIHAVRGLPRLRAPGIVPCIISFSRQLPCFLMM